MLVDLTWINPDPKKFTNWNTEGGSLSCTTVYGTEGYDHCVAKRMCKGVYNSHGLDNYIPLFTANKVEHFWERTKEKYDKLFALSDASSKEADELRNQLLRFPDEYGRADDLKQQIFRRGRQFIYSPEPCVLEVFLYDNRHEKNYKQGNYIGKKKSPDEVVGYDWIVLKT